MWNFLKEISTNGDMQSKYTGSPTYTSTDILISRDFSDRSLGFVAMDVVFPASPMLLYTNPELLRLLLVPVLNFANNGTDTPFTNPFSPHQLGTYPTADATTASQEPMPVRPHAIPTTTPSPRMTPLKRLVVRTDGEHWQYVPDARRYRAAHSV